MVCDYDLCVIKKLVPPYDVPKSTLIPRSTPYYALNPSSKMKLLNIHEYPVLIQMLKFLLVGSQNYYVNSMTSKPFLMEELREFKMSLR